MFTKKGFTLFELLVVISIIGLLMAIATVSFTTAQQNSRDARRRGDITGIRNAFEQYYARENQYPTAADPPATDACLAADITSVLPNGLPTDPQDQTSYSMLCSTTSYCVCDELEREGTGNASSLNCDRDTDDPEYGNYYCVINLQ